MFAKLMLTAPVLLGLSLATGCTMTEAKASKGDPNAQFLTETAQSSTSELELSRIAVDKASDPRVKQYAQMMVSDHTTQNQQLSQLASSKGMSVPDRVDEMHGKTATYLKQLSGPQFDQEYMSCMVADHAKLLSKMQDKAALAQDPEVRTFARAQVPILQAHLDQAREINRSLGGASDLRSGSGTSATGASGMNHGRPNNTGASGTGAGTGGTNSGTGGTGTGSGTR